MRKNWVFLVPYERVTINNSKHHRPICICNRNEYHMFIFHYHFFAAVKTSCKYQLHKKQEAIQTVAKKKTKD
jgi:hypothetical protein